MTAAPPTPDRTVMLVLHRVVVAALAAAGGIHLAVAISHGLRGTHGIFFALTGLAQVALALLVAGRADRLWLRATALLNAAVAGVWLVSRVPLLGGGADPVGVLDLATTALEAIALLAAGALLRRPFARRQRELRRSHVVTRMSGASLAVGAAFVMATVLPAPGHAGHDHEHGPAHGGTSTPSVPAGADERPAIFGDLFDDHGHHWGPAATTAAAGPSEPAVAEERPPIFGDLFDDHGHHWGPAATAATARPSEPEPHEHADGEAPHDH